MVDPLVQRVIEAAKRAAVAMKVDSLELDSVLVGITLLRGEKAVESGVADCLGTETVRWPDSLVQRAKTSENTSAEAASKRKFELGPVFKKIFNDLQRQSGGISLPLLLRGILISPEALGCMEVQVFHAEQKAAVGREPRVGKGMLAQLRALAKRSSVIEEHLSRDVIGQPDAIRMLAGGYLRTIRDPKPSGLRGIFTFMGPPGVGKTMLAEQFAEALSGVEGEKYETLKFSMEMADKESLLFTLFGVEQAYKTGKAGLLYDTIKANPRQVIVFDEIEKAPPPIIQALLTLLNDGSFRDRFENALVDLSKCFVIFTTNLGQDLFASRNRSGILRGSSFTSDDLFDLLAAAKRREHAKVDDAPTALAPEFVSRLRKGGAVLFNQLTGTDYLRLFDLILCAPQSSASHIPTISIADEAKQLLLLSLLPDISPRRVASEAGVLRERWIDDLLKNPPEALVKADPESFGMRMELSLDQESEALHKQLRSGQTLKVLVADNDERMSKFVGQYVRENYEETNPSVERVAAPSKTIEEILRVQPDLLLFDLDIAESELPEGGVLALHRRIVEDAPELPVFFFCESSAWEEKLPAIIAQGGARGFFSFKEELNNILIAEDQKARFRRLLADTLFEKIMAGLVRTRRRLELSHRFEFDSAGNSVSICISGIKDRQVVSLADESGGIRPSEIPSVTFDDVFGLERAKERLRDAVGFLKDPGRLGVFGIRPHTGFLLAGPSGTGKTHLARAVANAASCVFYSLSAGELESKWAGEGEERIRQLFSAARKYAPSVIFIDEIDAIAGDRASITSGSGQHVKMLNQLLVCMDGFADTKGSVLVLAATNRAEALDPAILRPGRFDETIRIEAPDAKAREQMFRKRLESMPVETGCHDSIPALICRTAGMSPAELDRIIREAAYLAARENKKLIALTDLEAACNLVRYGANRRDIIVQEQDRRQTAWHEAGHAVARLALFPGSKPDYLSIVPNEASALGFAAWQHDESKHAYSAEDYRNLIIVALAGREAEKLCPGAGSAAINTGASSDYERATALAWDGITRYGFDEEFGPLSTAGIPQQHQPELVGAIKPRIDKLLGECLDATKTLMEDKKQTLEKLSAALLEKQALNGSEVVELVGECTTKAK